MRTSLFTLAAAAFMAATTDAIALESNVAANVYDLAQLDSADLKDDLKAGKSDLNHYEKEKTLDDEIKGFNKKDLTRTYTKESKAISAGAGEGGRLENVAASVNAEKERQKKFKHKTGHVAEGLFVEHKAGEYE